MYDVKLILDSVNAAGVRLCTWELTYPRFVHAELMTHRLFSRNAASSRAIPVERMMARIEADPVLPKFWGKNQAGMAAAEELTGDALRDVQNEWLTLMRQAVTGCRRLSRLGLHKQIANRPTEAWMFITTLVTSTFHANWFLLRNHAAAQPELAWVAKEMHRLYTERRPTFVPPGAWHRPYVEEVDVRNCGGAASVHELNLWSAGRCAAVSYDNLGEGIDHSKDIARAQRMWDARPLHASPFEHVAQARGDAFETGNFEGWTQMRKAIPDEAGPKEIRFLDCVPAGRHGYNGSRNWLNQTCLCSHGDDANVQYVTAVHGGKSGCPECSGTGSVLAVPR